MKMITLITWIFIGLWQPALAEELTELSVDELAAMQAGKKPLVIDIRTVQEWQATGIIPESHMSEFYSRQGDYDLQAWLADLTRSRVSSEQPVVLVCRSGNRSRKVGDLLTQQLNLKQIYHLKGGIKSWNESGRALIKPCEANSNC